MEALELHYRINASILKYLELHEGKNISNTLGDFFKKCLDSSKFMKKSAQKEVIDCASRDIQELAPKDIPDSPVKTVEPIGSLGFQEQFLNSLNKLGSGNNGVPLKDEINGAMPVYDENEDNLEKGEKVPPSEDTTTKSSNIAIDTDEVKIIEETITQNVITISDSEEEKEGLRKVKGKITLN